MGDVFCIGQWFIYLSWDSLSRYGILRRFLNSIFYCSAVVSGGEIPNSAARGGVYAYGGGVSLYQLRPTPRQTRGSCLRHCRQVHIYSTHLFIRIVYSSKSSIHWNNVFIQIICSFSSFIYPHHLFIQIIYSSKSLTHPNHLFIQIIYSSKSFIHPNHLFIQIIYSSKSFEFIQIIYSSKSSFHPNHLN